jgi:GDP-D-mannose dehydratase
MFYCRSSQGWLAWIAADGAAIVRVDARYFRPTEVETLLGDANKAHDRLGWKAKTSFEELVREMALSDFHAAELSVRSNRRD